MGNIIDDGIVPRFVDANNIVKVYMKSHLGFHDILLLSRDICSAGLDIIASLVHPKVLPQKIILMTCLLRKLCLILDPTVQWLDCLSSVIFRFLQLQGPSDDGITSDLGC